MLPLWPRIHDEYRLLARHDDGDIREMRKKKVNSRSQLVEVKRRKSLAKGQREIKV
jgi:hypothetical protein